MLRRALRHAFTTLSALALLLCVAVCVLWVMSYPTPTHWKWQWRRYTYGDGTDRALLDETLTVDLYSARGGFAVHTKSEYTDYWSRPNDMKVDVSYGWADWLIDEEWEPSDQYPWWVEPKSPLPRTVGIDLYSSEQYIVDGDPPEMAFRWRGAVLPHWLLVGALAVLPTLRALRLHRRLNRGLRGLCAACGYDLRANKGGERCPECGTVVAKPA